jgi:hypothetical protein
MEHVIEKKSSQNNLPLANKLEKRRSKSLNPSLDMLSDIMRKKIKLKDLVKNTIDGQMPNDLKKILYKFFLGILPFDSHDKWEEIMINLREDYAKKVVLHSTNSLFDEFELKSDIDTNQHNSSSKCEDFTNLIKLDIERTFQEIDLFRNNEVKESLVRVLSIWSKENQEIGYCQGMNEILGTLYYSLYPNLAHQMHLETSTKNSKNEKDKAYFYYFLNKEEFFEADIFFIFSEVMNKSLKNLYNYNDIKFRLKNGDPFDRIDKSCLSHEDISQAQHSDLKKRINKIFYFYLRIADKELFMHIFEKVEPYLFLFRWILCMLNREISLKNILHVWDCIFALEFLDSNTLNPEDIPDAIKNNLNLLDYLCVAMICNIKEELMNEDDQCYLLSLLMHFPNENNIKAILQQALKLRDKIYDYFSIGNEYVLIE